MTTQTQPRKRLTLVEHILIMTLVSLVGAFFIVLYAPGGPSDFLKAKQERWAAEMQEAEDEAARLKALQCFVVPGSSPPRAVCEFQGVPVEADISAR